MKQLIICLLLGLGSHLYPQTIEKFSIDSGGASTISGNISVLYTVGEVNVQEYNVNGYYVSEGFIDNFILGSLGINNENLSPDLIRIYPNPASEFINIESNIQIGPIEIYNLLGSKVLKTTDRKIDIGNLQSGLYILKISTENTWVTKKIIIE